MKKKPKHTLALFNNVLPKHMLLGNTGTITVIVLELTRVRQRVYDALKVKEHVKLGKDA